MKTKLISSSALAMLIALGCSYMEVQTDYDRDASFLELKTYAWAKTGASGYGNPSFNNPLLDKHIHKAVNRELTHLGYERSASGSPDFLIAFRIVTDQRQEAPSTYPHYGYSSYGHGGYRYGRGYGYGYGRSRRSFYGGYGYGYGGYGYGGYGGHGGYYVREYVQGTLVLDIVDADTNEVIWRGWAIDSLDLNPEPEKVQMYVDQAVEKILERFPPTAL